MAFLTLCIIMGCWGRNQQQPYPTAPEAKIPMEASSSSPNSHLNLPLCSSPFLQELAEQMGFVPWLVSIPVFALEPARQQKGSGEPSPPPMQALTQLAEPKGHRAPPLGLEHQPQEEERHLQRQQFPGPAPAIPVGLFRGSGEEGKGKCRWQ